MFLVSTKEINMPFSDFLPQINLPPCAKPAAQKKAEKLELDHPTVLGERPATQLRAPF